MSHDELRVINQCALCQSKNKTPGELLAWNVRIRPRRSFATFAPTPASGSGTICSTRCTTPSITFTPSTGRSPVRGRDLDKDVGIVNWNGGLEGQKLPFLRRPGLEANPFRLLRRRRKTARASPKWVANTRKVPGIDGAMYTTWEDRYDAMDAWASKAWGERDDARHKTAYNTPMQTAGVAEDAARDTPRFSRRDRARSALLRFPAFSLPWTLPSHNVEWLGWFAFVPLLASRRACPARHPRRACSTDFAWGC